MMNAIPFLIALLIGWMILALMWKSRAARAQAEKVRIMEVIKRANGGIHNRSMLDQFSVLEPVVRNPISPFEFGIKLIKAQLENYELKNEQACCQPNGQSKNIDSRECFILENISPTDGKIIF